jgi:purine-nucleoside phosphorylase
VVYASLPGFPETTVAGHPGRLVAGTIAGKTALLLCGRVHGYEGYSPCEIGFGVRVVAALGVRTLIVTNASGGVDPSLVAGDIVAISDHINLTGGSPLSGPNDERLPGPAVGAVRSRSALRAIAAVAAPAAIGAAARSDLRGDGRPRRETPAEVRLLRWAPGWRDVDGAR